MIKKIFLTFGVLLFAASFAMAEMTEEEIEKLGGPNLTAIGAEKAGNEEGTIPPYTGGITEGPKGWYYEGEIVVPSSEFDPEETGVRPDPFADDEILYSITSENMEKHSDKLTPGVKALLKKFPNYRLDVYPTRRTAHYPKEIVEGTKKVAKEARTIGDKSLDCGPMGFPFPMPENGLEVVWNHLVRWSGTVENGQYKSYVINANGRRTLTSDGEFMLEYPHWDKGHPDADKTLCMIRDIVDAPPNRSGEGLLWKLYKKGGSKAWQYLPGQRRVKLAPEIAYDGPNTSVAGAATYDESYVFNGQPDRFEWEVLGKKEILIPYNCYKLNYHSDPADVFGPKHVNPDYLRWELHRVWVVEGKLKEEYRHIYKRRVLYIDEDTWYAHLHETYDYNNDIYRVIHDVPVINYDYPAPVTLPYAGYDLKANIYYFNAYMGGDNGGCNYLPRRPASFWSPSSMAGSGIR